VLIVILKKKDTKHGNEATKLYYPVIVKAKTKSANGEKLV